MSFSTRIMLLFSHSSILIISHIPLILGVIPDYNRYPEIFTIDCAPTTLVIEYVYTLSVTCGNSVQQSGYVIGTHEYAYTLTQARTYAHAHE